MKISSKLPWLCALGGFALNAATAFAAPPAPVRMEAGNAAATHSDSLFSSLPVSRNQLAAMRGGVDLGKGLVASFGISRMVYINGNLVASTSVNIPDLAHISAAQANALAAALNTVNVIRNGPGNGVDPNAFNRATGALVIQNTLDNQQIQALTTLSASVRDLGQFNSINLNSSLQSALIDSRGQ